MITKWKTISLVLLLGLAFTLSVQTLVYPMVELTKENLEMNDYGTPDNSGSEEIEPTAIDTPSTELETNALVLPNNTYFYANVFFPGDYVMWVMEDIPSDSAKYYIEMEEYNHPGSVNIDLYVKFGSEPTTSDYDYRAATGNDKEIINIEVPKDDEYGDMYVMAYCVSGSNAFYVRAWFVLDPNGCFRSADSKSTPNHGTPVSWSNSVDSTDLNDFWKVYLYSGQMLKIDAQVTTGSGVSWVDMYLYDWDHILLRADTSGSALDIEWNCTVFESGYYFIRFRYMESYTGKHTYTVTITDENPDANNRYFDIGPTQEITGSFGQTLGVNDFNDYWWFWADSGENITLVITMTEYLNSPYYDAFLYTSAGAPINDNYVAVWASGTTLYLYYCCGEYASSEVGGGTQNKIYLRIWNAARHAGMPDCTSYYLVQFTRDWIAPDDRISTAPDYTTLGANDTSVKGGSLTGSCDVNDYFKINTKAGYTIKIAVNTSDTPAPFLDGYLYDNTGTVVKADTLYNITLTYLALYDGNYYFRLYEAAAGHWYGDYSGASTYTWYIYTSAFDGNDNFTAAENIEPPETIDSTVSIADPDDYYQFEVPSGYEISLTGTCTPGDVELYLYDSAQIERGADTSSPWDITYLHKGLETETYYAHVHNEPGHAAVNYQLTITLTKIDPDGNGEMADADFIPVISPGTETGSGSLSATDINDYYLFFALAKDQVLISVDGIDGMVVRLIRNETNVEQVIAEATVSGGTAEIEYFPNQFYSESCRFYLRICNPGGTYSGSYSWNLTIVYYDQEDGWFQIANLLEAGQSVVIHGTLSDSDTNDWYKVLVRSGELLEIELTSTMPDPHVGMEVWGYGKVIYDVGPTLYTNFTNIAFVPDFVYIQVVNEAAVAGDYTLTLTLTLIDNDNNGDFDSADDITLDTDLVGELGYYDINDFYTVEIRSGYNLTVMYNAVGFSGVDLYVILWNEAGDDFIPTCGTAGFLTWTNPDLDTFNGYVQFYSPARFYGLNETECDGEYHWNATIVNNDPDGDFDRATPLSGPTETISDSLFANKTLYPYNLSDINDFYEINLGQGAVLALEISITGVAYPWFSVYIYDENYNVVASAIENDSYELLFNVGGNAGKYYIRFYNKALAPGDYQMALSVYTDTDSYFEGATPVDPGAQTPDDMSKVDISDFYSVDLEPGWRAKIEATLSGSSAVSLIVYDPSYTFVAGDFNQTASLLTEFTAFTAGTYYIEFYNSGGKAVDYTWEIEVYEDENGIFATATTIGDGELSDDVVELDKYDYFKFSGVTGQAFTITCSPPAGVDLELYLYNSTEGLIDSDTSPPGLAVIHTPTADDIFYILFYNPTGDTGSYSFTLSGASTTGPSPSPTETTTPTGGFFNQKLLGLPVWVWMIIGGGVIVLIVVVIVIAVVASKKRKGKAGKR